MCFLMVCKISLCSEFPDIPDKAGRKMRRRRRRTHPIAKRYELHANAKTYVADTMLIEVTLTVQLFQNCFIQIIEEIHLYCVSSYFCSSLRDKFI